MKIVFCVDNEPGQVGGGDIAIFKFGRALALRGHEVRILAKSYPISITEMNGFSIMTRPHMARSHRGSGLIDNYLDQIHMSFVALPMLKKWQPDIVCGVLHRAAIKAVRIGKTLGIPTANFYYETPLWLAQMIPTEWTEVQKDGKYRRYRELWEDARTAYKQTDVLIGNSELARKYCQDWVGKPLEAVVSPGIDLTAVGSPGNWPRLRQIVYVGRLSEHKHIEIIIESLAKLPNAPKFLVIGGGELKHKLETLAKERNVNVEFAGPINDASMYAALKRSMLLVHASTVEGFGMTPMDALACGTYALCSDIPILRSVYGDYIAYAPPMDTTAWTSSLQKLLGKQDVLKKKGEEGRTFVAKSFSWNRAAEQIEIHFKNTIKREAAGKPAH